jgi:hypothetical protein
MPKTQQKPRGGQSGRVGSGIRKKARSVSKQKKAKRGANAARRAETRVVRFGRELSDSGAEDERSWLADL